MQARARFPGGCAALQQVLAGVARTRVWCTCEEKSGVDIGLVGQHHELLAALHTAQANLSFRRTDVVAAIRGLAAANPQWAIKEEHLDNYCSTMAQRVLNMCRAVSQGIIRHPRKPPAWVQSLPWMAAAAAASAASAGSSAPEYMYGYCPEVRQAWRQLAGGERQWSCSIAIPKEAQPTDAVTATWGDGSSWVVSDVCVRDFQQGARESPKVGAEAAPQVFLETTHARSHNRVVVKERRDRQLLVSLFEQQRQLLQVRADACGGLEQAGAYMSAIGRLYASDSVKREDLAQWKRDHPPSTEAAPSSSIPRKRPAAAPSPRLRMCSKRPAASGTREDSREDTHKHSHDHEVAHT